MKKLITSIAFLTLTVGALLAQTDVFQNVYDYSGGEDFGNVSFYTPDNKIATVGSTTNTSGAGNSDAFLMLSDSAGNLLWQKQYGAAGTEWGSVFVQTPDSGFLIAGRSNSFSASTKQDILLVKTDANGDIQWSKTYGTDSVEVAMSIATTPDGGYIVAGEGQSSITGNNRRSLIMFKINATGDVQWYKTYGFQFVNTSPYQVIATSDNHYIAAGWTGANFFGLNDAYIVVTDSAGTILQQFVFGGPGEESARRIIWDQANMKAYIAGNTRASGNEDAFVASISLPALTFDWIKKVGNNGIGESVTDFAYHPLFNGYAVGGFRGQDGMLFILDPNGTYGGGRLYKGTGQELFQDININTGVLITGYSNSFGGGNNPYLAQFAQNPQAHCYAEDLILDTTSVNYSLTTNVTDHVATTIAVTAVDVTLTQNTATVTATDVCSIPEPLVANAGNGASYCDSATVTLGGNATASGGKTPYTYAWSPATGLNDSTLANPAAVVYGTQTYTVIVTDSFGTTASAQVTITINTTPDVTIDQNDTTVCSGQSVQLNASGASAYSWNPAGGLSSNNTASTIATPLGTITYIVTGGNGNCTDVDSVTITVNPTPNVSIDVNDTTICTGTSITLTASGATDYSWSPTDSLSSPNTASTSASPTSTTTYTVTGSTNGCSATASIELTVDPCLVPPPSYQKVYEINDSADFANMSVYTSAGHLVTVGTARRGSGTSVSLTELDTAGNVVWHKTYEGPRDEQGNALAATGDGYIIAGRSNSFSANNVNDVLLIKTDLNGNVVWSKTYGEDSIETPAYILVTDDKGFVVVGQTRQNVNGSRTDMLALKTDSAGNLLWFNKYGTPTGNEGANHVIHSQPGSYLAVGFTGATSGTLNDPWIVQLDDATGALQQQLTVVDSGDAVGRRIVSTGPEAYVIGTTQRSFSDSTNIFVTKIGFAGGPPAVVWSNQYGGTGNESPTDAILVPGFGLAVLGNTRSTISSSYDGILMVLNTTTGAQDLALNFQGPGTETFQDLEIAAGGPPPLAITGYTRSFNNSAESPYIIQFMDPKDLCQLGADTLPVTNSTATINFALPNHTATTLTPTVSDDTLTVSNHTATVTNVCLFTDPLLVTAGSATTICQGASVQLGATPVATGGTAPYTYAWSPAGSLSSATAERPTATPDSTTTYTVVVTDTLGVTASATVTITVTPKPDVTVAGAGAVCTGGSLTLTASGATTYAWSPATGLSATNVAAPVATPTATQTYTVIGTTSSCTDTATVTVTVNSAPTVTVSNDTTICRGQGVALAASGATTYTWSPATGLSATNVANPTANPTVTNTYTVIGTTNNCSDTATVTITVQFPCPGISEVAANMLTVFPNPAKDYVQVNVSVDNNTTGILSLTSIEGRIVYQNNIAMNAGVNTYTINTKDMVSGVYLIQLKAGESTINKRLVIQQ